MKVLILDNYDSFTFNLFHYVEPFVNQVDVLRNDEVDLNKVEVYDAIILSPGPGLPNDAGVMMELIDQYAGLKPILGVCLGHQALAEYYGAKLINMPEVLHGQPSTCIQMGNDEFFRDCGEQFDVGHYHSWVVEENSIPNSLKILAKNDSDWVMAFKHEELPIYGVQFHPESILTPMGKKMIINWLKTIETR